MNAIPPTTSATADAASIFRRIAIESPHQVTLDGWGFTAADNGKVHEGLAPSVVEAVCDFAYQQVIAEDGALGSVPSAERLLTELVEAVAGEERWDGGWRVIDARASGHVIVERGGIIRFAPPGGFATFSPATSINVGMMVSMFCPRSSATLMPGFFFGFGETLGDHQDDTWLSRFYWNICPDWAPKLFRLVSGRLDAFSVPFRMKCPLAPAGYARRDSAVLYVPRRMTRLVGELLVELHTDIQPGLRPGVPMFTRRLAPGLGFAEDPGGQESFGRHRARLVARAVQSAYACGIQNDEARVAELQRQFTQNGLDIARPYLSRARADYAFPAFPIDKTHD